MVLNINPKFKMKNKNAAITQQILDNVELGTAF